MSYDLTIRSDETYSRATAREALDQFLLQLPGVKPNGKWCFALDDPPERWMEIDLEVVSDEGDSIAEDWKSYDTTNCIRLHIPYPFLGSALQSGYLPTALAIAEFVGWPLYDEQTGKVVTRGTVERRAWWKLW
jgi:hypothetical protein